MLVTGQDLEEEGRGKGATPPRPDFTTYCLVTCQWWCVRACLVSLFPIRDLLIRPGNEKKLFSSFWYFLE